MDDYLDLEPGWADTAILLAGGLRRDGTLPQEVCKRADAALDLLDTNVIERIVCSGGGVRAGITEAQALAAYLRSQDAPGAAIVVEEYSRDTIGNAIYTKRLLAGRRTNFVIVTSDYHLPRALSIFRHVYGSGYSFRGVSSRSGLHHRLLKGWILRVAEPLLLRSVPKGDDVAAEHFVERYVLPLR